MKERVLFHKSSNLSHSDHSNHRPLRVVDILLHREDDDDAGEYIGQQSMDGGVETQQRRHGSSAAIRYYSPCRIVARLLGTLRPPKRERVWQHRQKLHKEPTEFESSSMHGSRSLNGLNGNEESGEKMRSLQLGSSQYSIV